MWSLKKACYGASYEGEEKKSFIFFSHFFIPSRELLENIVKSNTLICYGYKVYVFLLCDRTKKSVLAFLHNVARQK